MVTSQTFHDTQPAETPARDIFGDPVSYLASLGIESELVDEAVCPVAA